MFSYGTDPVHQQMSYATLILQMHLKQELRLLSPGFKYVMHL